MTDAPGATWSVISTSIFDLHNSRLTTYHAYARLQRSISNEGKCSETWGCCSHLSQPRSVPNCLHWSLIHAGHSSMLFVNSRSSNVDHVATMPASSGDATSAGEYLGAPLIAGVAHCLSDHPRNKPSAPSLSSSPSVTVMHHQSAGRSYYP